jgi:hypothetical protein
MHRVFVTKSNQLMHFREIITVYCENRVEYVNAPEFVMAGGTYKEAGFDTFLVPGHHVHRSLWNLDNLFWQPEYFKLVF